MDMSGMDMATSSSSMDMSGMDMAISSSSMDMSGMDMATSSSSMDMGGVVSSSHMTMSSTPLSSMTTAMMTMSSASASSASSMDMAGMVMASSSTSSLASAATSDSMSSMDMSGSDSSDSSQMQMWMTTTYRSTPVFFRTLKASSGGAAFGIFCVLFFSSFFFRGLLFLSSYLEQAVFHNFSNTIIVEDDCECGPSETDDKASSLRPQKPDLSFGSVLKQLFWTSRKDLLHDVIRLVLAFTIVMFGYAIMLAAMSFVILYFFAICLGLAFGEVFFNRLAVILDINKSFGACSGLH